MMKDDEHDDIGRPPSKPVGYGNPPVGSRYPKGVSGHPGRKRGSKNKPKLVPALTEAEQVAWDEARRLVETSHGKMSADQAVIRAQIKTAAEGGTNAQKAFLARWDRIAQKKRDEEDKLLEAWEYYVQYTEYLIKRVSPERRARFEAGLLPHPEHVEVDYSKREIRFTGPASSFERRIWLKFKKELEPIRTWILELRSDLEADPTNIALQHHFTISIDKYLRCYEISPTRYRPDPLPFWTKAQTIPWELGFPQPKRRRLKKNADLVTG